MPLLTSARSLQLVDDDFLDLVSRQHALGAERGLGLVGANEHERWEAPARSGHDCVPTRSADTLPRFPIRPSNPQFLT